MNEKVIIGTCEDMCPNFERKFRIKNKLVSNFECCDHKPIEKLMIKQYRRSAAGQTIDRKELRTIEALSETMNYLIFKIVDKYEKNDSKKIQEWYDFICNRTRAIRKDIIVQQLIGKLVIEIEEKCARFHILCSYILCDQQPNVFDFKINEEQLVNSIIIVRELYEYEKNHHYTIESAKSKKCLSNQSEFLCYYILQNLDKANLVQEISSIDNEIKRSNDLQFAIKVFIAYQTQNYFAFMQLLLRSTLLQACILNRYLNKIRLNAFNLIRKAVTVGQQKTFIPLDYFMRQLLFKQNELRKFCEEINCDLENDQIVFTKNKELNSGINFKLNRNALIDHKLGTTKLSKIVNGYYDNSIPVDELLNLFRKIDFFENP